MRLRITYGSPITNESPALIEGMRPKDPTRAAAASLENKCQDNILFESTSNIRDDVTIEVWSYHDIENPEEVVSISKKEKSLLRNKSM